MLPTPDTSHVPYQRVYEPAEDSFLLLDTLSSPSETSFLTSHFGGGDQPTPTPLVLEVGPGSGVVIAFLTANARTIFGSSHLLTLAVDVNRFACLATKETVLRAVAETRTNTNTTTTNSSEGKSGSESATFLTPLQGDLTTPLRPNQVDILVFNPPYVPTPDLPSPFLLPPSSSPSPTTTTSSSSSFAQDSHLLELSYAGGKDGMETTDRLINSLPSVLSSRGVAYILLCAQNKPDQVKQRIRAWSSPSLEEGGQKWKAETVGFSGKQAGWEKLQIVRIWRDGDGDGNGNGDGRC
ncbi:S-adenosylmethionine-dependent methyltransferase [Naviculisporaceae sp. PSN 640]